MKRDKITDREYEELLIEIIIGDPHALLQDDAIRSAIEMKYHDEIMDRWQEMCEVAEQDRQTAHERERGY